MQPMQSFFHITPHQIYIFFALFIPALTGIILHEVAHGYVAYRLGDPTAKGLGRLTLNPIKHIDPTGLLVFVLTALFSPFVIGWAKPVPVQAGYFKTPRQGMMLVAAAGPLTNFAVAALCAIIFHITPENGTVTSFIRDMAWGGTFVNCTLAFFNLVPIPPLDGSHLVTGILPDKLAMEYSKIGRYGLFIIIACLYFNIFSRFLWPLVNSTARIFLNQ